MPKQGNSRAEGALNARNKMNRYKRRGTLYNGPYQRKLLLNLERLVHSATELIKVLPDIFAESKVMFRSVKGNLLPRFLLQASTQ